MIPNKTAAPATYLSPSHLKELQSLANGLADANPAKRVIAEAHMENLVVGKQEINFFLWLWNREEKKRRQREKITRSTLWALRIMPLALAASWRWLFSIPFSIWISAMPALIFAFGYLNFLINLALAKRDLPQAGLLKLFQVIASEEQIGLLIEAFNLHSFTVDRKDAIRERISELLPFYNHSSTHPLDDYQRQTLIRELKKILDKRRGWPPASFVDLITRDVTTLGRPTNAMPAQADVTFLVAALNYFEQDVRSGETIPRELTSLLSNGSPPSKTVENTRDRPCWQPVQEATDKLLVRLNSGNR